MDAWSWEGATATRLARQGLSAPLPGAGPAEVASAVGAVHAQVMSAAELSIGLRAVGLTRQDVRRALWDERTLVKTPGPRGTVHLVAAGELATWASALGSVPAPEGGVAEGVRLTPAQTAAVVEAIRNALLETDMTVDELDAAVVTAAGPWAGARVMPAFGELWPRWRQAITAAAHAGALCFGPPRGRAVTYTSPSRWLPAFAPVPAGGALAAVVARFLTAFGPATPAQLARWLNGPERWATDVLTSLGRSVERVQFEGEEAWIVAGDSPVRVSTSAGGGEVVRLLPYFDAYVVGAYPRERVFPGRAGERALARGQAGNLPTVVIAGEVVGVWHSRRAGRRLAITVEPLRPLSARQRRAVDGEVERIGVVLEAEARWEVGTVTVRPHA